MHDLLTLRFRLFGFPIAITPLFWLTGPILIYPVIRHVGVTVEFSFWVLIFILLHELGHALAFRMYGIPSRIVLLPFGGYTRPTYLRSQSRQRMRQIFISFAGPLAGFVAGGLIYLVWVLDIGYPRVYLHYDLAIRVGLLLSVGMSLFNLVPMLPLDGGRMLYYALNAGKSISAGKVLVGLSLLVGAVIVGLAFYFGDRITGVLALLIVLYNLRSMYTYLDQKLYPVLREIELQILRKDDDAAVKSIVSTHKAAYSSRIKRHVEEMLAQLFCLRDDDAFLAPAVAHFAPYDARLQFLEIVRLRREGQSAEAEALLEAQAAAKQSPYTVGRRLILMVDADRIEEALSELETWKGHPWHLVIFVVLTLHMINHDRLDLAEELLGAAFEETPEPLILYNLACIQARRGASAEAIALLHRALDDHFTSGYLIPHDPDFVALQDDPGWQALVARVTPA